MKNRFFTLSLAAAIVAALASCTKDEELFVEETIPEGQQMLFDKTGFNPYLPENMQLAFDSMKTKLYESFPSARAATEAIEIDFSANNKYVRFLPADSIEFDSLMSYEDLALFDYPLDLPIIQQGEYTAVPANEAGFNWLYGVVPLDFEFPPITYETINEVFLPEYPDIQGGEELGGRVVSDSTEMYGMLMGTELYSMYLAGHLSDEEADELLALLEGEEDPNGRSNSSAYDQFIDALKSVRNTLGSVFVGTAYARKANPLNWCWGCIFNSSWRPNGKIQYRYNDNFSGIKTRPIKGLKVVIHRGLKAIVTYTNHDGNFESYRKFASKVSYRVHFRNRSPSTFGTRYFRVVSGNLWKTHKHTFRSNTRVDNITHTYDLTNNSQQIENMHEFAASVFVAAYQFYHGDRKGFARPRKNIRIRILSGTGRASHAGTYFLTTNQIKIYINDSGGTRRTAQRTIATTFHELGHASHFGMGANTFRDEGPNNEDQILKESWANYIEHHLVRTWFPNYSIRNYQDNSFAYLNSQWEGKYTTLFFDLFDDYDQSENGKVGDRPRDQVSDYRINQMQEALRGTSGLQELHDKLYHNYYNSSEEHLQELITSYQDNLNPQK